MPRILAPSKVNALTATLRTHRDRAMVAAMVLGGLRRCEVLGLQLQDVRGQRRLFITNGKGGHQRLVRSWHGSANTWTPTSISNDPPTLTPTWCSLS